MSATIASFTISGFAQLPPPPPTPRGCPVSGCDSGSSGSNNRSRNSAPAAPTAEEIAARHATALNDSGVAAYEKGDWAAAEAFFQKSLEENPNSSVVRKNLAYSQNRIGEAAYKAGNYAAALQLFKQAIANVPAGDPGTKVMRDDLAYAQGKIDEAQREQEQRQKDKVTANNMQQSIQNLAQTLNAAPSAGGLEFSDGKSTPKAAGSASKGLDFVAGDQLLSAASSTDLEKNYDRGGAQAVGSLKMPVKPSIDPAAFSPKVRSDPRMVTALKQLNALNSKRAQLSSELERLTVARNAEKDPQKSQELTKLLDQKHADAQANLLSITKAETTVKKTKRTIETEVEAPKVVPTSK